AIREMAKESNKKIAARIEGEEVEVDSTVLARLEEPLLHLLRNAVDHGLESPKERALAGKPETGQLTLKARQSGAQVEIVVRDDGRGIEVQEVAEAAVKRGFIAPEERDSITADDAAHLLFDPGFSTRDAASETSGRGIGLDIVRQQVAALGGRVAFDSLPGQGTEFRVYVPASVVRAPTLMLEHRYRSYGVPSMAVTSLEQESAVDVVEGGPRPMVRYQDALWLLDDLARLLNLGSGPSGEERKVLFCEHQGRRVALAVERVRGEEAVIFREMAPFARGCRTVTGTAVSSDGRLVVLLNVPELIRLAVAADTAARWEPAWQEAGEEGRVVAARGEGTRVMVVDDSELTRDMLVTLISDAGYEVVEAVEGRDALEKMKRAAPDIVLTDLEMPVMDGFVLLRTLRGDAELRRLPVVVCSTRGSDEDRERAAQLGADGYVVKTQFTSAHLLSTLGRFAEAPPSIRSGAPPPSSRVEDEGGREGGAE
ncbi:MAG: response regulator, partial [Myxococcota bacterium]